MRVRVLLYVLMRCDGSVVSSQTPPADSRCTSPGQDTALGLSMLGIKALFVACMAKMPAGPRRVVGWSKAQLGRSMI